MLYAARFPHKVAVNVGSAQYGDAAAGEAASCGYALAEAQRRGKHRAVKKLGAIGPPPHTAKQLWTERTCVTRLEGGMRPRALWKMGRAVLAAPGIVDSRPAEHDAQLPVLVGRDVGADLAAEPPRPRVAIGGAAAGDGEDSQRAVGGGEAP